MLPSILDVPPQEFWLDSNVPWSNPISENRNPHIVAVGGSILASFMRTPKSRVRVICNCLPFFHEYGEFPAGVCEVPSCVVRRRGSGGCGI